MAHIVSRVNGLRIAIPADARNIVHRFAVAGGGNELIFEPIKKSDYEHSLQTEGAPVTLGEDIPDTPSEAALTSVELSVNVADDEDEQPATSPSRGGRKNKPDTKAKDDII